MPNLRININGRFYDITCDKNKEKEVLNLSKKFDEKVKELSGHIKTNVDHPRLLVLAGILLTEELEKSLKQNSKVDNPYSLNYKNKLEETKKKNIDKNKLIKEKIDNLIDKFQSLSK